MTQTPNSFSEYLVHTLRNKQNLLAGLALSLLTVLLYFPVLGGGYIVDDNIHLTKDSYIPALDGLYRIWFEHVPGFWGYWPVSRSMFWIEHKIWEFQAAGYFAVNIALHAFSGLLLWRILIYCKQPGAWLAGLFFIIHPLQVETLGWVSQQRGLWACAFMLLSLWYYLHWEVEKRWQNYGVALILFGVALLNKSSIIMFPVVLIAVHIWLELPLRGRGKTLLLPFFALSLAKAYNEVFSATAHDLVILSKAEGLLLMGQTPWFYLGKWLWPFPLSFNYTHWPIETQSVFSYLPGLMIIALFLLAFRSLQKGVKFPLVLAIAYFANLFPVAGFFGFGGMRYAWVADHWAHIALLPLSVALAQGVDYFSKEIAHRLRQRFPQLGQPSLMNPLSIQWGWSGILLLIWGLPTFQYAQLFANEEQLYLHTLKLNPDSWMTHNNLGTLYSDLNQFTKSLEHYSEALRIKPDFQTAYNNRGRTFLDLNQFEEAYQDLKKAVELKKDDKYALMNLAEYHLRRRELEQAKTWIDLALFVAPEDANIHESLSRLAMQQKDYQTSLIELNKAIQINPYFFEAYNNRGAIHVQLNQPEKALEDYSHALKLQPGNSSALSNRGNIYLSLGKIKEAMLDLNQAISNKPNNADARYNRAMVFIHLEEFASAVEDLLEAKRWEPSLTDMVNEKLTVAYNNLGIFHKNIQNLEKAIEDFNESIKLKADYAEAYSNRGTIYLMQSKLDLALLDLNQALKLNPRMIDSLNNRGIVYTQLKDFEKAQKDFKEAIKLQENDPRAYSNRGMLYMLNKQKALACKDWLKACELNDCKNYNLAKQQKDCGS